MSRLDEALHAKLDHADFAVNRQMFCTNLNTCLQSLQQYPFVLGRGVLKRRCDLFLKSHQEVVFRIGEHMWQGVRLQGNALIHEHGVAAFKLFDMSFDRVVKQAASGCLRKQGDMRTHLLAALVNAVKVCRNSIHESPSGHGELISRRGDLSCKGIGIP